MLKMQQPYIRNEVKNMSYNVEGVLNLRNAIVIKAADDYLRAKTAIAGTGLRSPEAEKIKKWFIEGGFNDLETGISGEYIIDELDKLAEGR